MAPTVRRQRHTRLSLFLATVLIAAIHLVTAGSDCSNATRYPWLCLPIHGTYFHGAPLHRTFAVLLCSGPQCASTINWGPLSLRHRIVDRLVLFNANPPNGSVLELPRGWLQDIRVRDLVFIDTKLQSLFLTDGLLASQDAFLSGITAQNSSIGGVLSVDGTLGGRNSTKSPMPSPVTEDVTQASSSGPNKGSKPSPIKETKAATKGRIARWIILDDPLGQTEAQQDSAYTTVMPARRIRFHFRNSNVTSKLVPMMHHNVTALAQSSYAINVSRDTGIQTENLQHLRRLFKLDLSHNNITAVAEKAFPDGLKRLRLLLLSRNSIKTVASGAFANLPALARLDLSYNRLQAISRDVFGDPNSSVELLDLSSNLLATLPGNIFKNMFALKEVGLANNYLQQLPPDTWMPVWNQITALTLNGNFIACDCDTLWIRERLSPLASVNGTCSYPEETEGAPLREFPRPQTCP